VILYNKGGNGNSREESKLMSLLNTALIAISFSLWMGVRASNIPAQYYRRVRVRVRVGVRASNIPAQYYRR
jgi:hypothetical protein